MKMKKDGSNKCLSREETQRAWVMQHRGKSAIAVAMQFHVDVATLYRCYHHYGFEPPVYKKRR